MPTQKPVHGCLQNLFITAKMQKQPTCSSVGEWMNTLITSNEWSIIQC